MTNRNRFESLLCMSGFTLMASVFLFAFYLPGHKASAVVRGEIANIEQSIRDIPLRVEELEQLRKEIEHREEYLARVQPAVPIDPDVHDLLDQVADLARNSSLSITRLQPLPIEIHESYQRLPFQLNFAGPYRGVVEFFKGIESGPRLFAVQKFSIRKENGKDKSAVQGDMQFSIYISHAEKPESDGNSGKTGSDLADTTGRTH